MTQFLRPDSDVANVGVWITAPLFDKIDEVSSDPADFIQTPVLASGASATCEIGLSDGLDPLVDTDHEVHYAYALSGTSTGTYNLAVELREGASIRASWSHLDIAVGFLQADQTLTGPEADSITDYTNLRLFLTGSRNVSGGTDRRVQVSWAVLEIPDEGVAVDFVPHGLTAGPPHTSQ